MPPHKDADELKPPKHPKKPKPPPPATHPDDTEHVTHATYVPPSKTPEPNDDDERIQ